MSKRRFSVLRGDKVIYIPIKRSVEKDYPFYDPPEIVWNKINLRCWDYRRNADLFRLRDKALMCLLYLSCCRVSEVVRAEVKAGYLPSVRKSQFVVIGDFLMFRGVKVVKHKYVKKGGRWVKIESVDDYPVREEIDMPLKGGLSKFTNVIVSYLEKLEDDEELFKFGPKRAHQIVKYCSGEFPHYFREMGLKLRLRLFDKNIVQLQEFSGHKKLDNLVRYLREIEREESRKRMLEYPWVGEEHPK